QNPSLASESPFPAPIHACVLTKRSQTPLAPSPVRPFPLSASRANRATRATDLIHSSQELTHPLKYSPCASSSPAAPASSALTSPTSSSPTATMSSASTTSSPAAFPTSPTSNTTPASRFCNKT